MGLFRSSILLFALFAVGAFCLPGSVFGQQGSASIPSGTSAAGVFVAFVTKSPSGTITVTPASGAWTSAGISGDSFLRVKATGLVNSTCVVVQTFPPTGLNVYVSIAPVSNPSSPLVGTTVALPAGGASNFNVNTNFGYDNVANIVGGGLVSAGQYGIYVQRAVAPGGPGSAAPCTVSAFNFSAEIVIGA